jgi:hypothetical protein
MYAVFSIVGGLGCLVSLIYLFLAGSLLLDLPVGVDDAMVIARGIVGQQLSHYATNFLLGLVVFVGGIGVAESLFSDSAGRQSRG